MPATPACSSPNGQDGAGGEGERPGVRVLGVDPATGDEITLRSGRFGDYVQQGEGEKPKRCSLPKGLAPDDVTLEKAIALLSLPREVARHPSSGEPILAGIGRYGSYVQHGKTYANLGRDDDVLEIGANRAIDLIVAKESGAGAARFGAGVGPRARRSSDAGRRDLGQAGPLRPLCQSRQDQRDAAEGNRTRTTLTLEEARGGARGQGRGRRRRAGGCSAIIPRAARSPCATGASAPMSTGARSTRRSRSRLSPDTITLAGRDRADRRARRQAREGRQVREAGEKGCAA